MEKHESTLPLEQQLAAWQELITEVIDKANDSLKSNADLVAGDVQRQIDAAIELAAISVRGVAAEAAEAMAVRAGQAVTAAMSQEVGRLLETIEASNVKTATVMQEAAKKSAQNGNAPSPSRLVWFALGMGLCWLVIEVLPSFDLAGIKEAFGVLKMIAMGAFK